MDDALTPREQALVGRYGGFYRSLNGGQRQPTSPAQARFVEVCRGRAPPETEHEVAFAKYLRLVEAQREAEAARRDAERAARENTVEEEPGQRSYSSRFDAVFDDAARWASKKGFRV